MLVVFLAFVVVVAMVGVVVDSRNLTSKFGKNWVSNSRYIVIADVVVVALVVVVVVVLILVLILVHVVVVEPRNQLFG